MKAFSLLLRQSLLTLVIASLRIQTLEGKDTDANAFATCGKGISESYRQLYFDLAGSEGVDAFYQNFAIHNKNFWDIESQLSMAVSAGSAAMIVGVTSLSLVDKVHTRNPFLAKSLATTGGVLFGTGFIAATVFSGSKDNSSITPNGIVQSASLYHVRNNMTQSELDKSAENVMQHWAPALSELSIVKRFEIQQKIANSIVLAIDSMADPNDAQVYFFENVSKSIKDIMNREIGEVKVKNFLKIQERALEDSLKLSEPAKEWVEKEIASSVCSPTTIEVYQQQLKSLIEFADKKYPESKRDTMAPNLKLSLSKAKEVLFASHLLVNTYEASQHKGSN